MIRVIFWIKPNPMIGGEDYKLLGELHPPVLPAVGHVVTVGEETFIVKEVAWKIEKPDSGLLTCEEWEVYLKRDE